MLLLTLLGAFGLALTLVGIFSMTAYAVARRTREIGVRMALGARPAQVVGAMVRDALWPVAFGLAAGLAGTYYATQLIAGFLFLSVGWRLLPRDRAPRAAMHDAHAAVQYATEADIPANWPESLATVSDLKLADRNVQLTGLISAEGDRRPVDPATALEPGMVLQLKGEEEALGLLFQQLPLPRLLPCPPLRNRARMILC